MNADRHTTEQAPETAVTAPRSASTPEVGVSGSSDPLAEPQTGAQRFQDERKPHSPVANPTVQGRCPACRGTSLFLGNGGYVTCSRLDCPNPSAADELLHGTHDVATLTAQARVATAEVERLRAGEEPGYDPLTVPTPGQWIARWNQAGSRERLDVAGHIIENQAQAARCFEMNHESRLADERKAWVIVARIRDVIADMEGITGARHWARILRKVVDGEEPAPVPAATQATGATDRETTARVFAALHRSAEEDVTRVIQLAEQWATRPERADALRELTEALQPPAHNAGPSIREAADQDAAHWNDKYAGEGQ